MEYFRRGFLPVLSGVCQVGSDPFQIQFWVSSWSVVILKWDRGSSMMHKIGLLEY